MLIAKSEKRGALENMQRIMLLDVSDMCVLEQRVVWMEQGGSLLHLWKEDCPLALKKTASLGIKKKQRLLALKKRTNVPWPQKQLKKVLWRGVFFFIN